MEKQERFQQLEQLGKRGQARKHGLCMVLPPC
jgi:hypothetical protein